MDKAFPQECIGALREHPVFIGGIARSGTTLLQSLLDGHPQLVVDPSESRFFLTFEPRSRHASKEQKAELVEQIIFQPKGRFLDPEGDHYRNYFTHISYASVREAFYRYLEQTSQQDSDYLSSAILAFGEVSGQLNEQSEYWVEKTIFNEWYAPLIFSWWKEAKFIHVLRDPRDVYATWKRRDANAARPLTSIDAFSYTWGKSAKLALNNQRRFGRERYLVVYYERLVQEPEGQIARIAQFLDIIEHMALLTPSKAGGKHRWNGNSSSDRHFAGISPISVGQWRKSLAGEEVTLLEVLLGDDMEQHGYQLETSSSTLLKIQALACRGKNLLRAIRDKFKTGK